MWWKLGLAGMLIAPFVTFYLTWRAGERASRVDPSIGGAYVASLFFSIPLSLPIGFVIGALIGWFFR